MLKSTNKFKNEKEFQSYFWKYCKENKRFYYKIPDVWHDMKPFDCFIRTNFETYFIELKVLNTKKCWVDNKLEPQQRWNLELIQSLWWISVVWVYYKKEDEIVFFNYNDYENWFWFEIIK